MEREREREKERNPKSRGKTLVHILNEYVGPLQVEGSR